MVVELVEEKEDEADYPLGPDIVCTGDKIDTNTLLEFLRYVVKITIFSGQILRTYLLAPRHVISCASVALQRR